MSEEKAVTEAEKAAKEDNTNPTEATSDDGEFKITVRKLEMPVRPRGVLAE